MQGIVPEKHQRRIFDQLIQSGLDLVIKEGEVRLTSIAGILLFWLSSLKPLRVFGLLQQNNRLG